MVHVSDKDASWTPCFRGFRGMSTWEETSGQTLNMLEGLHILSGLNMLWDLPRAITGEKDSEATNLAQKSTR